MRGTTSATDEYKLSLNSLSGCELRIYELHGNLVDGLQAHELIELKSSLLPNQVEKPLTAKLEQSK